MTKKMMIDTSIGLLLITAFITAMSACGTVDTSNFEISEAILEQSSVSSTEQANYSAESEAPSSQTDISISFQEHSMETEELDAFGYWLYTPENPTENMPLIVYLHGASGRGEDLNLVVADEDFPKYLQSGDLGNVRAYVLIPQLPADLRSWSDIGDSLYSLIQKTVSDLSIDTENISLSGFSMGGTAVWELAAGHMPKDADFNCGVNDGRTPVEEYADVTRGAHGAVDFWGNVWEWTSTVRSEADGKTILGVKGGSWESERTDCRTEYREEGRDAAKGYEDVGFRIIQVKNGEEPEKAVALTTLDAPTVTAASNSEDSITLS